MECVKCKKFAMVLSKVYQADVARDPSLAPWVNAWICTLCKYPSQRSLASAYDWDTDDAAWFPYVQPTRRKALPGDPIGTAGSNPVSPTKVAVVKEQPK